MHMRHHLNMDYLFFDNGLLMNKLVYVQIDRIHYGDLQKLCLN